MCFHVGYYPQRGFGLLAERGEQKHAFSPPVVGTTEDLPHGHQGPQPLRPLGGVDSRGDDTGILLVGALPAMERQIHA